MQVSRRNAKEMHGRTDGGVRVVLDAHEHVPSALNNDKQPRATRAGDYILATVYASTSHSMRARPLLRTDLVTHHRRTRDSTVDRDTLTASRQ
jgi:hypothetical protein